MFNKLKKIKLSKLIKFISSILLLISFSCFLAFTIIGSKMQNNSNFVYKIQKINQEYEIDLEQSTINNVLIDRTDMIILKPYFIEGDSNNLYYNFYQSDDLVKEWNQLFDGQKITKLEENEQALIVVLEKYENKNKVFQQHITLMNDLDYNLSININLFPIMLTLLILNILVILLVIGLYIKKIYFNKKLSK